MVDSGLLNLLNKVYQCIFVDLKWLQAVQICSVIIKRLRQNSPTIFLAFITFHVSSDTVYNIFFALSISWKTNPRYFSLSFALATGLFFFRRGFSQYSIQQQKYRFSTSGILRASTSTPNFSSPRLTFSSLSL